MFGCLESQGVKMETYNLIHMKSIAINDIYLSISLILIWNATAVFESLRFWTIAIASVQVQLQACHEVVLIFSLRIRRRMRLRDMKIWMSLNSQTIEMVVFIGIFC